MRQCCHEGGMSLRGSQDTWHHSQNSLDFSLTS